MEKEEENLYKQTVELNFSLPFRDYHLVSQDYIINKSVLENWTLNRIKVPDFKNRDEMKDWIIAVDFIVKSESFIISGSSFPYYYAIGDESYYTKQFTIEDVNGVIYHIPERNYYNKNAKPSDLLDTKVFYNYLTKYVEAYLNIDSYGPCFSNEKVNEKYFFNEVNMCGIVEFLLNNEQAIYLPPKDQLKFGIKTEDYSFEDDFNETNVYWRFKDLKENNNVFVIECKYFDDVKKDSVLEYFDSWRMWHEKFIKNNTMYFVIFQTDEIHDANLDEYFSILTNEISKRYSINAYSTDSESYIQKKSEINSNQKSEINTTKDIIASIKNENKRVYLFCVSISSEEDIQIVTEQIFEKIHLFKNFIKTNIDDNVSGFLFEEFDQSYKLAKSLKNKSIDDPDFKEFIMQILQKYTQTDFNGCFEFEFRTSFIFDLTSKINEVGFIDVWNEKFLELSAEVGDTIRIYGYHEVYEDIITQIYDCGEWETGLIASEQGYYDWPLSSYIRSEAGWKNPQEAIFDLTTYKKVEA